MLVVMKEGRKERTNEGTKEGRQRTRKEGDCGEKGRKESRNDKAW